MYIFIFHFLSIYLLTFTPKSLCEVVSCNTPEETYAKLVFLRKRKYKEFEGYIEKNGMADFLEIFKQEDKFFVRDIQFRTCYELKAIEWHVLKLQDTTQNYISCQAFQSRMFSMAELVLAGQFPILGKEGIVCNLPYLDDECSMKKRRDLVSLLYTYMKPIEVTGKLYWSKRDD